MSNKYYYATKDKYGFPVPGTLTILTEPLDLSKAKNKIEIGTSYGPPVPCQQEVCHPNGMRYFIALDKSGNPIRIFSQFTTPQIKNYVEFKKIIGVVCFSVQTFTGVDTPSYPMGVFNISGGFIGFANNASDYVTLWNSDPINTAVTTISNVSGNPNSTLFAPASGSDPGLRGCRYWQVDVTGWAHLGTGEYDRILYDNTLLVANTYAAPSLSSPGNRFWANFTQYGIGVSLVGALYNGGLPPGYVVPPLDNTAGIRQVNINIGAVEKTVTVFHNESSQGAGFVSNINSALSGNGMNTNLPNNSTFSSRTKNLRGTWPPECLMIVMYNNGTVRENIYPSNITNYNELTKVVHVDVGMNDFAARTYTPVGPWNPNEYTNAGLFLSALPNKSSLISVQVAFYRILDNNSSLDGTGISTGAFPNLKCIKFSMKSKPFTPNAATFPLISQYFSLIFGNVYGGEGWTSAEMDAIYNMLGTRLVGIFPVGIKRLDVQWFNASATAASLTARTYLAGQGWIVN